MIVRVVKEVDFGVQSGRFVQMHKQAAEPFTDYWLSGIWGLKFKGYVFTGRTSLVARQPFRNVSNCGDGFLAVLF